MAENYFGITDTGKQRSNNEDTFVAQQTTDGQFILAGVIDGVGGYAGGEVAAAIARETIIEKLDSATNLPAEMITSFAAANEKIFAEKIKAKEHDQMACVCTLAMVDVKQNQLYYSHVGDTRLYLFRDGSLVKISSDHSFVGFLEDSGRLTEEAAMNHPKRNEINKALGFEQDILNQKDYVETGNSPFLPGDMLLLCSDGLTDMVNKTDITAILTSSGSLKEKGKQLIDMANHNGGRDNITVVLVKNDKQPVLQEAVLPSSDQKKKPEIVEKPVESKQQVEDPIEAVSSSSVKNNKGLVALLAVLCLVFLVSTIALFLRERQTAQKPVAATTTDTTTKTQPEPNYLRFVQLIQQAKKDTLTLSDSVFKNPILISKTITISKDTLFIKATGNIVLKAASGFNGPAFITSPSSKIVVLDHLTFDGFKTAIVAYNNSLVLKKVKFINSENPVQVLFTLPNNTNVTGWLPANTFKSDTLQKVKKQ